MPAQSLTVIVSRDCDDKTLDLFIRPQLDRTEALLDLLFQLAIRRASRSVVPSPVKDDSHALLAHLTKQNYHIYEGAMSIRMVSSCSTGKSKMPAPARSSSCSSRNVERLPASASPSASIARLKPSRTRRSNSSRTSSSVGRVVSLPIQRGTHSYYIINFRDDYVPHFPLTLTSM